MSLNCAILGFLRHSEFLVYQVLHGDADKILMQKKAKEILISASQVGSFPVEQFEFILNEHLQVLEGAKIVSAKQGLLRKLINIQEELEGCLFELNHVRVNPKLNNQAMIDLLIEAFQKIGVTIRNLPSPDSMQICYKPLGEITYLVRFYLGNNNKVIFLSPAMRPKIVPTKIVHLVKTKNKN